MLSTELLANFCSQLHFCNLQVKGNLLFPQGLKSSHMKYQFSRHWTNGLWHKTEDGEEMKFKCFSGKVHSSKASEGGDYRKEDEDHVENAMFRRQKESLLKTKKKMTLQLTQGRVLYSVRWCAALSFNHQVPWMPYRTTIYRYQLGLHQSSWQLR